MNLIKFVIVLSLKKKRERDEKLAGIKTTTKISKRNIVKVLVICFLLLCIKSTNLIVIIEICTINSFLSLSIDIKNYKSDRQQQLRYLHKKNGSIHFYDLLKSRRN